MKEKLNIALVAHDARKQELIEWVKYNVNTLKQHNLYATGTTGKLIEKVGEEWNGEWDEYEKVYENGPFYGKVNKLLSGPLGGDSEIGTMIAHGEIDVLIFFCDNLITQGHQQDVGALSRLASLYNIAFATNRTTADHILTSSLFNNPEYERITPSVIGRYKNRVL